MKISAKMISQISGFSEATVSNVLNNRGGFTKETKDRILEIAEEIGYRKKPADENNGKHITFVIYQRSGRVVEETSFFSQLFAGVSSESQKHGFLLEMVNLDYRSSLFESSLNRILETSQGIIFLGTELDEALARTLIESGKKVVVLDNWLDSMDITAVSINNVKSAFAATQYLLDSGHRKIGYLKSKYRINNFKHRSNGYRMALNSYGVERSTKMEISLEPNIDDAYREMNEFLRSNHIVCTAFFADNDNIAFGACKALVENGYRIPQDISIIGFDDLPYCTAMQPSLSTVRVSKSKLGEIAVQQMVTLLGGEEQTVHILVNTDLIIRDSVREIG